MSALGLAFFILFWVVFVYSIVLHEVAHGWVAFRLGDPTAYQAGRLTLDPIKHIHPIQSILMPLLLFTVSGGNFIFGGAKPVPVNPLNYKNVRTGMILDSAAGPLTNFLIAAVFALALKISLILSADQARVPITAQFLSCCMMINVFLAAFNLLPIPPLDGSHILEALLPRSLAEAYGRLRYLGFTLLILLLILPPTKSLIGLAMGGIARVFLGLMGVDSVPAWNPTQLL